MKLLKLDRLRPWIIAMIALSVGGLLGARLVLTNKAKADSDRVFELRIYHDLPGKLPMMERRFREKTSKILARHNLKVVGYWVTTGPTASENAFIFLLAHNSQEEAKKNWTALIADPDFQEIENAEKREKTLQKAETLYLRPTDLSPMR